MARDGREWRLERGVVKEERISMQPILHRAREGAHAAGNGTQSRPGNRTVPTIDIDGIILTNPSPAKLRQVLGV